MRHRNRGPRSLLVVRHGESAGNVARDAAEAGGLATIDILERDMDVPLSALGERQAAALGVWLDRLGRDRPTIALSSPYARAERTAAIALETAGLSKVPIVLDERLREREFGALDRLTKLGIQQRFPEEATARLRVGKFYHRPPGGESWCDVALRVRSVLDSMAREFDGERLLVIAHEVVVLQFCYVLEHLTEHDILALAREHPLANCSVTSFVADRRRKSGALRLDTFGTAVPLEQAGAPVTREHDAAVASH
ncbi:MAG: 2,3-bisphosphoglycerate-dependent phosphoglycerate mutase [Acidimicrobiaceae bacterium]|jgi:broad specificity phosphatase PhoE